MPRYCLGERKAVDITIIVRKLNNFTATEVALVVFRAQRIFHNMCNYIVFTVHRDFEIRIYIRKYMSQAWI